MNCASGGRGVPIVLLGSTVMNSIGEGKQLGDSLAVVTVQMESRL